MKKIYISGCGGMLGEAFYEVFGAGNLLKCTDIDVNAPWLTYLDIRDLDAYRKDVADFSPDYLFHLGACTDMEYCERNPENAWRTNAMAAENAAYIANELGIPLLYIGTAGIFDGHKQLFDDWDTPNPLSCYARSKYAGELFVREHVRQHLVCRGGWMMGGGPAKDKKFVQKIMRQLAQGKKELSIVNDKFGSPTYTHDFAHNVKVLLETEYWGVYNMACDGLTSRVEVARAILELRGLQDRVAISEVPSSHFREEYFAERPPSECLVNAKLKLRQLNTMRHWKVALKAYLDDYYPQA
ncbi:NAD(P)-dependent oxidoreductase [Rhodoferax sp. AJA081-3]|uniref:SDR family oxidoreductase n=1 Tax=Rhodoferax sp. AJA081-3 TaxID=2752316 RepID=UPI001ADF0945|nr:NAD(P)-dependent oxidoreductase [Rhodoferax sp. AJA081-3]QTN30086.1 NAD(P)-dependent oxidoreductase [Rhodoferax sp. AJA081-3]